jgi:hypothetical protein
MPYSTASQMYPASRMPRLSPPGGMSEPEREVFVAVVNDYPADKFRPSDALLLRSYARAVVLEREAAVEVNAHVPDSVKTWSTATRTMLAIARSLRLTTASREPNVSGVKKREPFARSSYDRWAAEELEHDDGPDGPDA